MLIDTFSRNPAITWDKGVFPGQEEYNYPELFDAPSKLKVTYSYTAYEFIPNKLFSIANLFSIGFTLTIAHKGKEKTLLKIFVLNSPFR